MTAPKRSTDSVSRSQRILLLLFWPSSFSLLRSVKHVHAAHTHRNPISCKPCLQPRDSYYQLLWPFLFFFLPLSCFFSSHSRGKPEDTFTQSRHQTNEQSHWPNISAQITRAGQAINFLHYTPTHQLRPHSRKETSANRSKIRNEKYNERNCTTCRTQQINKKNSPKQIM